MTNKASKAAIQKACDLVNKLRTEPDFWKPEDYPHASSIAALADTLQAISDDIESGADMSKWVLPKPVDPNLLRARELLAAEMSQGAYVWYKQKVISGCADSEPAVRAIIKALTEQEASRD